MLGLIRSDVGIWILAIAGLASVIAGSLWWASWRRTSFRAQFERYSHAGLGFAPASSAPIVTQAELAPLPEPVQRYLRAVGVVGQPRVRNYRVRFRGRIRSGPDAAWMRFEAEQQSFVDPPIRLFLMRAKLFGLPVASFHRLIDGAATMQVRVAGAIPIVDARGPVMDRSETVTLFNDMSILVPGSLLEPSIRWEPIDSHTVRAWFTHAEHTIAATLSFDDEGLLCNFVSDDRSAASADGKSFTQQRFSTPVRDYRMFGGLRLAGYGEAHWHPSTGEFAYGEFEILDVSINVDEHPTRVATALHSGACTSASR